MIGPDNNISGFSKSLYLYIALGIALIAGVVVYSAEEGNTESSLQTLSRTSQRFAKALAACKTGTFDLHGISYTATLPGTQSQAGEGDTASPILTYTNHAVRGNVNSDAFYDMVCTYDLTNSEGVTQSYVGVLFGGEDGKFYPGPMLALGSQVKIDELSINTGISTIRYSTSGDESSGAPIEKKFFLEGDTLTFADTAKGGI
jgi:hypothetical protein